MNRLHTPFARPARNARKVIQPLERFFRVEAASGVVLLSAAVLALLWANSPGAYESFWHTRLTFGLGRFVSSESLHFWITDGLMTVFFLFVGLEIRRELHDGALSNLRLAVLPVVAALGGVIAPALIYLALNSDTTLARGWAVPIATDIAFALGVLTMLGKRVPSALRVMLLALAIIDDIVAILVIAFFYSGGITASWLWVAAGGSVLVLIFQRLGIRAALPYVIPGGVLWLGLLQSGVNPTLAGVILGLLTPVRDAGRVESALHPWVSYGVMPLFALANAGVRLEGLELGTGTALSLSLGIVLALVVGKPLGILLASVLTVKSGLAELPPEITWRGVLVLGCLGGIGFTMSIFIAALAFADASLLSAAKLAVLIASSIAASVGLVLGRLLLRQNAGGR